MALNFGSKDTDRFFEGLMTRKDIITNPRKTAAFFQEYTEYSVARNESELKSLRNIIQTLQKNLACTTKTPKHTGSKKNFEKGQKQRKAFVRYLVSNLILCARNFSTVKIPMDQNWWATQAKEYKTYLSGPTVREVMKEFQEKDLIEIVAKHHEQSENCRCYAPTDKFLFNVAVQAHDLITPWVNMSNRPLKTPKKHKEKNPNWTHIQVNKKTKGTKDIKVISKKTGKERIKTIKTLKKERFYYNAGNYNVVFTKKEKEIIESHWILKQYETIDKKLIVRITKEQWNNLNPTKKTYIRTLIYSNYLKNLNPLYKQITLRLYPNKGKDFSLSLEEGSCTPCKHPYKESLSNLSISNKESERKKTITHTQTIEAKTYKIDTGYYADIPSVLSVLDWDTFDIRKGVFANMEPEYFEYELSKGELFRVFSDDEDHGGRYYGSTVQKLPKEIRQNIVIQNLDGTESPLVELDYSQLHPTILYCEKGLTPPEHPYGTATGSDREERKMALLVMINAEDKDSAVGAMRQHFRNGMGYTKRDKKLSRDYIESLFDEVSKINEDIKESFFTGEGARLQSIDSTIATRVMKDFMESYPGEIIECLHDSFMVPELRKHYLKMKMVEHFQNVVGTSHVPQITVG